MAEGFIDIVRTYVILAAAARVQELCVRPGPTKCAAPICNNELSPKGLLTRTHNRDRRKPFPVSSFASTLYSSSIKLLPPSLEKKRTPPSTLAARATSGRAIILSYANSVHVLCHTTKTFDSAVTEWGGPIDVFYANSSRSKTTQELKCEKLATRIRKRDDLKRRKGSFKFAVLGANGDVFMGCDLLGLSLFLRPTFNDTTL